MESKNKRGSHSREPERKKTVNKRKNSNNIDSKNRINKDKNFKNSEIADLEKTNVKKKQTPIKKKHKIFRKILKTLLIFLIIVFIVLGVFLGYSTVKNGWGIQGILATLVGHDSKTVDELGEFQVLLLGVSTDISAKLTDTIIVASYDPKTQKASLLSIPRDTFIGKDKNNPSGSDKINSLYQRDPQKILDAVNDITGLSLKYYVVVDNQVIIDLVNKIGGVEFNVPIDMDYDDPTQDLHINLKAGLQKINGEKAEQLLRFRHNNDGTSYPTEYGDNDYGRMRTQREFIKELVKQTITAKNIVNIKGIIDILYKNIETNVDVNTMKDYLPYAVEFNTENLKTDTLPGESQKLQDLWFFVYNKKETLSLVQELFYDKEIEELNANNTITNASGNTSTNTNTISSTSNVSSVKIELLNGSGNSEKLIKITALLKKQGYNVAKTGATTSTDKTTIVKNNSKIDSDVTTKIKKTLGIGTISNSATTSSTADITIIIGKDYK